MKKHFALIMMLLLCVGVHAESAKRILDKAAATVSNPGGVRAHFQMISKQFGNTNGEIAIKARNSTQLRLMPPSGLMARLNGPI